MRAADESSVSGAIICLNLGSACLELFQEQRRCKYESCDCTSKASPIPSGYSARSTHHSKEPEAGSEIRFQRFSCHSVWPFNSMERRRCPGHQTNIYAMEAVGVVLPQGVSGGVLQCQE